MSIFGNLFDEIEEDEGRKTQPRTKTGIDLPPASRLPCDLCGIVNQGATCYLNSLLQTLLYTAELRESLFCLTSDELGCSENGCRLSNGQVRIIPLELQRLFARLLLCNQQAISTAALTDSFGWSNHEELQQHDVQELNRILFGAIEDSLVHTTGQNLISRLYHGSIVNQIVCSQCNCVSEKQEDFLDISVAVPGNGSLQNGLFNTFCENESLTDKNRYHCDRCQKLVDARRMVRIRTLPPILTVSLLRFSFDFNKMQRFKDTNKLTFPHRIDMSVYLEKPADPGGAVYELFSVVNHKGGAYGGHYNAYIRDVDQLGTWISPDEEELVQCTTKVLPDKTEAIDCDSPEKLVYDLLSKAGDAGLKIDRLCTGITQHTGLAWNKCFKKKHGPIVKFLKLHSDKFRVDEQSCTVFLKQRGHFCDGLEKVGITSATNHEHTAKIRASVSDTYANTRKKRPQSPGPEPGYCWFNFNDSHVHPIRTKDIEKMFSGKESAYMLFYRSTTALPRRQSGMTEAQNNIPPHLVTSVLQENEEVDKQREEHEIRINEVHIEVHFSGDYVYTHGALRPVYPATAPFKLTLDRRKPVAELLVEIAELPVSAMGATLLVHRLKEVPAGFHLYDCISAKSTSTLEEALICDGSKLFGWDGQWVQGTLISTGDDYEPINITVIWGNNDTRTQGFPKCHTIGDLKVSISELVNIATSDLILTRIPVGASNEAAKPLTSADYDLSLGKLKLENGSCILAESRSNRTTMDCEQTFQDKQTQPMTKIKIENRCTKESHGDYPLLEVPAEKYTSVGELKALALSLMTDWPVECRLRVCHDSLGLRPPLCEDQTLEEAGVTSDKLLVLELGPVPDTDQLTVTITLPSSLKSYDDFELMVNRQSTVANCLTQLLEVASIIDETWHLRKTNWCQEPGDILDDPDATLDNAGIHSGDFLLLEQGKLPRKGFVHVSVLLFPVDKTVTGSSPGLLNWLTDSIQGLLLSASNSDSSIDTSSSTGEPVDLGIIEFSKTATLAELKSHLLTLPGWKIRELTVPSSVDFLRVRHVQSGRLSTVFRDPKHSLQRLKVTTDSTIGIQLLQHGERLSPHQVLLKICQHLPGTRRYSAEVEFVCDLSRGRTVAELRQEMAAQVFGCPPERLILAKHWPQKFEWTILKADEIKGKVNNQKSKKTGKASLVDLKATPYYLTDGDLIGVKDVLYSHGPLNDFSTEEDISGLAELQRFAEEKRNSRKEKQACPTVMDSQSRPRRPEVPLTIKVDRFS